MPSTSFSRSGDVDSRDSIRCQPFASSTASWMLSGRGHAKWGRATTGHSSRQGTCWRRSHASRTPATTVQSLSPVNSIDKPTRGSRTARHDANAQVTVTAASIVFHSRIQRRTAPAQRPARQFVGPRSRFSKRKTAARSPKPDQIRSGPGSCFTQGWFHSSVCWSQSLPLHRRQFRWSSPYTNVA